MKTSLSLLALVTLSACSAGDDEAGGTRVDRLEEGETPTLNPGGGGSSDPGGSGSGGTGGLLPDDEATPNEMNCGLEFFDVERRPADVLLVLDRSGSMREGPDGEDGTTPTKWDLAIPAVNQVLRETNAGVSWGMKLFPEGQENGSCSAASINDQIHVPIAAGNAETVVNAIAATTPDGDGTPTGDAVRAAVRYLTTLQSPNDKYILLATDGEPSCSPSGEGQENARPYAVSAVQEAAAQNIPVFVVGVATNNENATQALNDMANAGGVPRPALNPLAPRYYLANTQDELVAAFRTIAGEIASCVFPLSKPPPVPDNIAVKLDGVNQPRDPSRTNGWEYTDASLTAVEVYGPICDQIQSAAHDVQVVYACRGVIIE